MVSPSSTALILSGGGARAAYQVGVLRAIARWQGVRQPLPFQILSGTSAGAINATALATWATCLCSGVRRLEMVWGQFHTGQVFYVDRMRMLGHLGRRIGRLFQADYAQSVPPSLLNPSPLRQLLVKQIPFARIDHHIRHGRLRALAVTASSYSKRTSVSFYSSASISSPWQRARRSGERAHINESHLLASAALPFLFPPVRIRNQYFADGTINQLSPLSPVIHLGAEKILVIGTQHAVPHAPALRPEHPPSAGTIAGYLLDTIFSDALNADLERAWRINQTLELIPGRKRQKMELKPLDIMVVQPSQDIDAIAAQYFSLLPPMLRWLLERAGARNDDESALLSYLLFEGPFCQQLMALGDADAERQKDALAPFLGIMA